MRSVTGWRNGFLVALFATILVSSGSLNGPGRANAQSGNQQPTQPVWTAPAVKAPPPGAKPAMPNWQTPRRTIQIPATGGRAVGAPRPSPQNAGSGTAQGTPRESQTAGPSAAAPKWPAGSSRTAAIVYSYMGDNRFISFFQETMRLKKIMEMYDFIVLLKHDYLQPWMDLSEKDERMANVKDLPTKANLFGYLKRLADEGYTIDLWIIAHGGPNGAFLASSGQYRQNDWVTPDDIRSLAGMDGGSTGYYALPIRLVHHTSCWGSRLAAAWHAIGADVVVGSRFINFYPTQTIPFAKRWSRGEDAATAYRYANTARRRTLVQSWIVGEAAKTRKQWGGCRAGNTVLGKKPCAKRYFQYRWAYPDGDWQSTMSGKQNMNYASTMLITANAGIRITDIRRGKRWRRPR